MYSFLLMASRIPVDDRRLRRSASIVRTLMPPMGAELEVEHLRFCDSIAGYLVRPKLAAERQLLSIHQGDESSAIVYGELFGKTEAPSSRQVHRCWRDQGVEAVRMLNGCFSAVLIDPVENSVTIVADLLGRRSVRYACEKGTLLVAPHDVLIISTGLLAAEFDPGSIASILLCDWSIAGKSLLKGIQCFDAHSNYVFAQGSMRRLFSPLLIPEARLVEDDQAGIDGAVDEAIADMRTCLREFCTESPRVNIDLTAGIDTRATLAIALSAVDSRRLLTRTAGSSMSRDFLMARRIAREYGIRHQEYAQSIPDYQDFLVRCTIRSALLNGDTNAKRALGDRPDYAEVDIPSIYGGGGEIYRGYYYPRAMSKEWNRGTKNERVPGILQHFLFSSGHAGLVNPRLLVELQGRLDEVVDVLSRISSAPADILDLFYLFERYGRWGSVVSRLHWKKWYSPFDMPTVARRLFALPTPISRNGLLHKRIIRRYLGKSYFMAVNDSYFVPLFFNYGMRSLVTRISHRVLPRAARMKARPALRGRGGEGSIDILRSDIFRQYLREEAMQEAILSDRLVSEEVLRKDQLSRVLREHLQGTADFGELLGRLLSIGHYRQMVIEASRLARSEERG